MLTMQTDVIKFRYKYLVADYPTSAGNIFPHVPTPITDRNGKKKTYDAYLTQKINFSLYKSFYLF